MDLGYNLAPGMFYIHTVSTCMLYVFLRIETPQGVHVHVQYTYSPSRKSGEGNERKSWPLSLCVCVCAIASCDLTITVLGAARVLWDWMGRRRR